MTENEFESYMSSDNEVEDGANKQPGASILNSAQDLMGGKMVSVPTPLHEPSADKQPWQAGFGSGGPNAWRDVDPNDQSAGQGYTAPQQHYQPPPQEYNSYNAPPQQQYNSYQAPSPQQYQGGYDQNQNQGYGQQQNYGGLPPQQYGGNQYDNGSQGQYQQGPPHGQWDNQGGYQQQQQQQHHHKPPQDNGNWGPPGGYRG